MSQHYYRDYKYGRRRSKSSKKLSIIKMVVVLMMLSGCVAAGLFQLQRAEKFAQQLAENKQLVKHYEEEMSILRTLNPYHIAPSEIISEASTNVDLFPGWVTRVYPVPKSTKAASTMSDLGSFIMNETRFSLSSHKRYGIEQPTVSMYRLNGLYPHHQKGRLQVGVEFYLSTSSLDSNEEAKTQIASCYARIDINQKRVIDKKLNMVTKFSHEQVVIGEVELAKGLFPISAMLYCDDKSDFKGDEVQVSISFRHPGQYNLSTSRNAIFHIYKPNRVTAQL